MRLLAAITVAALLGGCGTYIYEDGQKVMAMQSDATNVTLRTARGLYFHADTINNSVPTMAAGQAVGGVVNSVSAGVVGGMVAIHNPVPAVVATAIPPVVNQTQAVVRPQATNLIIQSQWRNSATGTFSAKAPAHTASSMVSVRGGAKHRKHHHRHVANASPPKD